ncbi:hypothetical protein NBRC110019_20460 [Neptunitalea chrysea]|uniref:YcxB-like protein domain-containing protein n=1 Tax=Neptunitalea chrysea TaxID=1647581 RepID=A0A9W6B5P7_9FLAO|nr:hypothetical protein [Neptunitalea chrysea]GLB53006.1 hypothetical protein NBRC110019_20460 [Neptunitalea chrysea]
MLHLTIKADFKEYMKLMYWLIYRKTAMQLVTFMGLGMVIMAVLAYSGIVVLEGYNNSLPQFVLGMGIAFVFPATLYYTFKKGFYRPNGLHQTINYEFTYEGVKVHSDLSSYEEDYNPTYVVEEFNYWFVIFSGKTALYFIPKKDLGSHTDEFISLMEKSGMRLKLK